MRGQSGESHGEDEFLLASLAIRIKNRGDLFLGKVRQSALLNMRQRAAQQQQAAALEFKKHTCLCMCRIPKSSRLPRARAGSCCALMLLLLRASTDQKQ